MTDCDARVFVTGDRGMAGGVIVRQLQAGGYRNLLRRERQGLDLQDPRAVHRFLAEQRPTASSLPQPRQGNDGCRLRIGPGRELDQECGLSDPRLLQTTQFAARSALESDVQRLNTPPLPMPDRPLDLGSLRAAVQAPANAVDVVSSPEFAAADPRWRDTLVAGVVQHFEFTFELCWKMLKRQLEREVPSPLDLDGASYRELFRLGHERGLVSAVESWFDFRELRNITSLTYARDKALEVAAGAPLLLVQARALLSAIEARNHD